MIRRLAENAELKRGKEREEQMESNRVSSRHFAFLEWLESNYFDSRRADMEIDYYARDRA